MSIHQKLAEVHMKLMGMKINKSGYNNHKRFAYYELEDIMGPVTKECYEQGLTLEFAYCEDVAILKIVDWENPKEYIPFRVKMPEVITPEKNPNNQIIQTVGANISYLQRYLLKLAFPCLSDKDMVDSSEEEASSAVKEPTTQSSKKDEVADLPMGELIVQARDKLIKRGVDEGDITTKALKQTIMHMRNWKVSERRCIINYFKDKEAS